jgi:hypothetical protein
MRFTLYDLFTMILDDPAAQGLTNAEDASESLIIEKAFRGSWLTDVRKMPRFGSRCRPPQKPARHAPRT